MEEILTHLAVGLPALGYRADVVALQPGPLIARLREAGVPTRLISAGRLRQPHNVLRTVARLARLVHTGGYDLVYSNMATAHLYAALGARATRTPALWCQSGFPDPPGLMDRAATVLPAKGVIALSREAVASQERMVPRRRVYLMHPGIDLGRYRVRRDLALRAAHGLPANAPLVSIVGRLQPWKGQQEFLEAAARVRQAHPECRFAVVGGAILGWEGDYPARLEAQARKLGLADAVFTGHTSEVNRWMAASDIVVNASSPEPFGLVVVEALASGCAVIAIDRGGPRDIIENGHSGLLCATREPSELARAIGRLIKDEPLRARLGHHGRSRVERDFTREAMIQRFAMIVADATATRRGTETAA
ncbi:MAG: glycosyltransferase family 4 protein [Solirubrobacteraceae bacterium]